MAVALPIIATVLSGAIAARQAKKQNARLDAANADPAEARQVGASNTAPVAAPGTTTQAAAGNVSGSLLGGSALGKKPGQKTLLGG